MLPGRILLLSTPQETRSTIRISVTSFHSLSRLLFLMPMKRGIIIFSCPAPAAARALNEFQAKINGTVFSVQVKGHKLTRLSDDQTASNSLLPLATFCTCACGLCITFFDQVHDDGYKLQILSTKYQTSITIISQDSRQGQLVQGTG